MTALDDRPASDTAGPGFAAGFDAGYRAAEAWAVLARRVRDRADRVRGPIPQPVARPQPDAEMWFTADEWSAWAGAE